MNNEDFRWSNCGQYHVPYCERCEQTIIKLEGLDYKFTLNKNSTYCNDCDKSPSCVPRHYSPMNSDKKERLLAEIGIINYQI